MMLVFILGALVFWCYLFVCFIDWAWSMWLSNK